MSEYPHRSQVLRDDETDDDEPFDPVVSERTVAAANIAMVMVTAFAIVVVSHTMV